MSNRGFTLIELMMTMAIIACLCGMLMPILSFAQRSAKQSAATCSMAKIDIAVRGFRTDAGHLPWSATPTDAMGPWGNDLASRLTRALATVERTALDTDIQAMTAAYASGGSCYITLAQFDQPQNIYTMSGAWDAQNAAKAVICLNRMASERGRVATLSGNVGIRRTKPDAGRPWVDGDAILSDPLSHGWGDEYLAGELPPRETANGAILDPWGRPYVYFQPVVNGVLGFIPQDSSGQILASWFGLHARTRSVTTALASDMRTHAPAAGIADFELWSAGPDGLLSAERSAAVNRDNLAASPYLRGLH